MRLLDGINDKEDELYTFDSVIENKKITFEDAIERIKPYLEIIDGEDGETWGTGEYEEQEALNTLEKELEISKIIKRFLMSDASDAIDLWEFCEQYDEVNNTNITKLIGDWLEV